jgi:rhodanese-related sulfurtransferase
MYIRPNFDKVLKQAVYLVLLAAVFGLAYNLFSFRGIALVGAWAPKVLASGITVPPSYMEGEDAPVINLSEAMTAYNSGQAIFLDARTMEDYKAGHIKGAIQLYMEEFEVEYAEVKDQLPKDALIITYCGGDECELSLFLTRNLKEQGFANLKVFFGGWKEWVDAGLPTVTGENP